MDSSGLQKLPNSNKVVVSVSDELETFDKTPFDAGMEESVVKLADRISLDEKEREEIITALYPPENLQEETPKEDAPKKDAPEETPKPVEEVVEEPVLESAQEEKPQLEESLEIEVENIEDNSEGLDIPSVSEKKPAQFMPPTIFAVFLMAGFFMWGSFGNLGELNNQLFQSASSSKLGVLGKSNLKNELFTDDKTSVETTKVEEIPAVETPKLEVVKAPETQVLTAQEPAEVIAVSALADKPVTSELGEALALAAKPQAEPAVDKPAQESVQEKSALKLPAKPTKVVSAPEVKTTVSADKLAMNELVTEANTAVATRSVNAKPDKPIDWQNEKEVVEEIKVTAPKEQPAVVAPATKLKLSSIEKRKYLLKKSRLRADIANAEARILSNSFSSKDEIQVKVKETEAKLADLNKELEEAEKRFETSKRKRSLWLKRQDKLLVIDPLSLAAELSNTDPFVREAKEFFEIEETEYSELAKSWRKNPSDTALASQIAAKQTELKARKAELIKAIRTTLKVNLEQAEVEISEQGVVLEDLKAKRKILNRSAGLYGAARATSSEQKTKESNDFATRKKELLSELRKLRAGLSDEAELELRKSLVLKKLGLN